LPRSSLCRNNLHRDCLGHRLRAFLIDLPTTHLRWAVLQQCWFVASAVARCRGASHLPRPAPIVP
jgi:hypothetical protein